jgi:hypothetical protein
MSNPTKATGESSESTYEPRYSADELQPQSAMNEWDAMAEREDGTIRGSTDPEQFPIAASADAVPIIRLTPDEQQPIDAIAEYHAVSEREDGTNIG